MNIMAWFATTICLLGTILNVKKYALCFYLWCIGNTVWFIFDCLQGLYSRALLDTVQFALAVWGIVEWSSRREKTN